MDEISPKSWIVTDFDPVRLTAPRADRRARAGRAPSWLLALPQAAALMFWKDGGPTVECWNDHFERLFGAMAKGSLSPSPEWMYEVLAETADFAMSGKESHVFELERQSPLGPEAFACSLAWVQRYDPPRRQILFNAVDRTSDRRMEENLRRELVSDTLTALPNRIGFGEAMEATLLDERLHPHVPVAVLIVDLVRFGRINEALGTMAGDELILTVAARLNATVGGMFTLARLGGNEFGIFLVTADGVDEVMALADRVRAAISVPIRLSDLEISMSCALGCALAPAGEADADELIRQAQTAARIAKTTDRLEIYRAGELGAARQRFMLETRLRDALAGDLLHLQYQPIIHLASSRVVGFEALARWRDEKLGTISPQDFIPVAEESGLVVRLGQWAVNEAMRQLKQWDARLGGCVPVKMNVNLSPIQMARDDVIAMVGGALDRNGIDGRRLTIELTESAVVANPESSRHLLEALKQSDVVIAMDDFGTGYSNMASLQSLPIDLLKIDRSFVTDMLTDPDKLAIIRAILSLAATLGMKTTAEGIESADVAAQLRDLGCDYGQGYYFARPLMADDAYDFWLSRLNSDT